MKIVKWQDWYFNMDQVTMIGPMDKDTGTIVFVAGKHAHHLYNVTTDQFMAECYRQMNATEVSRAFYDAMAAERKTLQATVEAMRLEASAHKSEIQALRDQLALCQAELAAHK
jgi:hypothetical protein